MSFIRVSFTAQHERVVDGDLVGHAEHARLPVRGPSGRIYVLHADGSVTQHPTSPQASFALLARPGSELLLWLVPGAAVAAVLARHEARLMVRIDLEGASTDEQRAAAEAVDVLLVRLPDVELEAVLV